MSANPGESDPSVTVGSHAEEFPTPPKTITDDERRVIRFRSAASSPDERDSLAAMYDTFGPSGRAQGIPPANDRRRQQWLDRIEAGVTVVAWHGERAVGHGILLGDESDHELALFVHPEYRGAGIGSTLLETLLGHGRAAGVERVWLSVEQTNRPAVHLYREAGFVPTETARVELKMSRSLA